MERARPKRVEEVTDDSRYKTPAFRHRAAALKTLAEALLAESSGLERTLSRDDDGRIDLFAEVQRFETELIRCALIRTGGRQRPAAQLLGMKITTLNSKVKRYNINVESLNMRRRLSL